MLNNHLKITIRHLTRQKILTFINIFGLSIALGCCLWIYLFISDELSFDEFHENIDSIYSIIQADNHYNFTTRQNPNPLGPALKEYFPEILHSVRIVRDNPVIRYKDKKFLEGLALVDADFFNIFSFKLLRGNKDYALTQDDSLVLTKSKAEKYFMDEDPLGKILTITFGQETKDFLVSGILEDIPSNSTLQFDIFVNIQNVALSRTAQALMSWTAPQSYTYIQLKAGVKAEQIERHIPSFIQQYMSSVIEERRGRGAWLEDRETILFRLQNLKDVHLHSRHIGGGEGSDIRKSLILGGIGLLVLLIAGINFMNLSIAGSSKRSVEIGMRKVLGAERKNLLHQFWSESVLTVIFSMILGLMLAEILISLFNQLADKNLSIVSFSSPFNIFVLASFTLFVGFAAGIYPGVVLARFQPVETLRRSQEVKERHFLNRPLLIFQFSVSIFLIISTLTMGKQIKFIQTRDLGFDKNGIITIATQERGPEGKKIVNFFRDLPSQHSDILSVSGCSYPFSQYPGTAHIDVNGIESMILFSSVYYDYEKTLGMRLVEGRGFSEEFNPDGTVVVNQEFVRHFKLENPIGKDAAGLKVIGIVEDYNYMTVRTHIEPVLHVFNDQGNLYNVLVRISPQNTNRALTLLEKSWSQIRPNKPFIYTFFDEDLSLRYSEEKKWNSIVFYSSVLAILITCMGLIGITSITINKRIKEIGIRKILGASVSQIAVLIVKQFTFLVLISNAFALPISYYIMRKWLQGFAFRVNLNPAIFILAAFLSFFVALITITGPIFKAAYSNPVNSLRNE
ncbi:ABC transporter permease [Acidobacteriota bacterium]